MSTVSVVVPTFNRAGTLLRAVKSVLQQSYKPSEIIVVDDGSEDETQEILREYDGVEVVLQDKQRGVSAARNKGVAVSTGDWIAFLDSDDEWMPEKLEKQMILAECEKNPLIHGEEIWIRHGRRVNPKRKHKKSGGDIFENCLKLCLISPSAVLIRRELFEEMGGFDENFPVCEDYDLWLKITSLYRVGFVSDPILIKYGGHPDQLSHRYKCMDYWRVLALERILSLRNFDTKRRQSVVDEMIAKARVLEKGMIKHENREHLHYIQKILATYGDR